MSEGVKTIIDSVVLNGDINPQVRLKTLDALLSAVPTEEKEIQEYLTSQTETRSQLTNQMAQIARDWINQ
jgi:hypothetical protein